MYELEIKKSPDSDISDSELEFVMDDLVNAIEQNLSDDSTIKRDINKIFIEASMKEIELKDCMKPAFKYHFDDIRYVSLKVAN
jgi:hypothetical protein